MVRSDVWVISKAPPSSTGRGDQRTQRFGDQRSDPSAGGSEVVEARRDLVGSTHEVEQTEQRNAHQRPPDRQPVRTGGAASPQEGDTGGDQSHRDQIPADAGEPPDEGLDPPADGTGEVEVDRKRSEHASADQAETYNRNPLEVGFHETREPFPGPR